MRNCPKCGRANNVTRKFCTRCGASLLVSLEEPAKEEKVPAPKIEDVKAEPEETYTSSTEPASATTEDKWVRPSEVDRDRLRTT
ncbi:MAG: zinc-ribbon domain-containing protein, partial [Candidatus Thorarchaeota archaeon]